MAAPVALDHAPAVDAPLAAPRLVEAISERDIEQEAAILLVRIALLHFAFIAVRAVDRFQVSFMPTCGAVILVGFTFGGLLNLFDPEFERRVDAFSTDTFLLYILPPIIFDAGFNLTSTAGMVSRNAGAILMFAILGTVLSTVVIGLGIFFVFSRWTSGSELGGEPMTLWEAFAFGSLISAVDPVATLAVLGEVFPGTKPKMYYLVFGESVLNDAVAIVLYTVSVEFMEHEVTFGSVMQAIVRFIVIFLGSVVVAVVVALGTAALLRTIDLRRYTAIETAVVLFSCVGVYSLSEYLEFSGVMSVFTGGRLVKHWALKNVSLRNRIFIPQLTHSIAELCDLYVFSFLGAAFFVHDMQWCPGFICAVVVLIIVGRAVNIFPIAALCNLQRSAQEKITGSEQVFMWVSGLRGAIAFILAVFGANNGDLPHGQALVTTTLVIVMVTVFIFGGTTKPLLRALGLTPPPERGAAAHAQAPPAVGAVESPTAGPAPPPLAPRRTAEGDATPLEAIPGSADATSGDEVQKEVREPPAVVWRQISKIFRLLLRVDRECIMRLFCNNVTAELGHELLCRNLLDNWSIPGNEAVSPRGASCDMMKTGSLAAPREGSAGLRHRVSHFPAVPADAGGSSPGLHPAGFTGRGFMQVPTQDTPDIASLGLQITEAERAVAEAAAHRDALRSQLHRAQQQQAAEHEHIV
eukprot:TRINITY_DN4815_c0_g2_i1.p1 TRINITY_DN4815_c0_g2~~TRINITY_DN4815_c0_g2_i1.p1  ORF type:complete len:729 (+),score=195.49 TRINITY_DN4815_c0_g2_i1:111-2189(+)